MMLHETDAKAHEDRCVLPKPSLDRTITPGYMAAVMSSPEVLCNLCQQYFRQYDKNKNGFMECHEAVELAKDLGSTLAVPLGSTEDVLRPSLKRFSEDGRDALNLEEFCRWFPTVLGLEPLSPQHIEEIKGGTKENQPPAAGRAPSLQRTISPGYVAALGSSPQTMRTFCKQLGDVWCNYSQARRTRCTRAFPDIPIDIRFFKQYDTNGNGVLEYAEVERLANDLFLTLGISLEEGPLKECLDTSNHQGDAALSLDAFCDWLPALFEAKLPKLPGASKSEGEALAANKGYLHALKSSPRTLVQLCRQYFRDYDFNKNSFLDDAEVMALARDLSERLEVPLKSSKELKESIGQFSDNGSDCLSFGEFARWFATMMGLEEPMMKEIVQMASED